MLIAVVAAYGVKGGHEKGCPGVWTDSGKIAAIGVHVNAAGITRHGFALNVNTDLRRFDAIVPCGLYGRKVTSLERQLGRPVPLEEVAERVANAFAAVFGVAWEATPEAPAERGPQSPPEPPSFPQA